VIVLGNLTVGGTGKTPVVEKFAHELSNRGRKLAVLSRGYQNKSEPRLKIFLRWITHTKELPLRVASKEEFFCLVWSLPVMSLHTNNESAECDRDCG
jgi:tetraacyldisaccharide 4'-kinase